MGVEVKSILLVAIAVIAGMMMQVGSSSVTIADEQVSVPVRSWADEVVEAPGVPDLGPAAVVEGAACESGACSVSASGSSSCESAAGPVRAVGATVIHRLRERPILRGVRSRLFGGRCR